jgi:hypothetical protein
VERRTTGSIVLIWKNPAEPSTIEIGIVTASPESMLTTRLRAELRKWFRLFRGQAFFELTATAFIFDRPEPRADLFLGKSD